MRLRAVSALLLSATALSCDRTHNITVEFYNIANATIAKRELRGTLFHELHHLVRAQTPNSLTLMDRVVGEGLATVFERDAAGMPAPWGQYPPDVVDWVKELNS